MLCNVTCYAYYMYIKYQVVLCWRSLLARSMGRPVWHWWLQQRHRCPAELCCEPQLDAGAGAVKGEPNNQWMGLRENLRKSPIFNIYGYV
jgi:hypothetical protein